MSAAVKSAPADSLRPLNPTAISFVSSRSESDASEAGSPLQRSGSPDNEALQSQYLPEGISTMEQQRQEDPVKGGGRGERAGGRRNVIPAPAPRIGLSRQRSSSSSGNLHLSGSASPPLPALPHPGMVPTYGWGAPFPVYHVYRPQPHGNGAIERSASPPAVFPAGGSPPLPTGFISVPLMADPSSPTSSHLYGASPPPFGASHPPYGSSPPGMVGSPPGMMYMPPPPPVMHHGHHGGEYGISHAGYTMQHQHDFVQRMAGMSLVQQQPMAQQQRESSAGSTSSPAGTVGGRSEGRASARIARSHRAGGAYNPAEFEFDLQEAESGRPDARRTVMIRNIPNKYTQDMMLSVLHKSGFSCTFDFFYLPIDFRNKCNLGYCFVNFLDAATAARLYREYHNKRWEEYNSKKVCEITYGRVQGRDMLVQHFRASKFPSDDIEFMPLVYTRVAGATAADPVPIHDYLGSSGNGSARGGSPAAEEADGAAAAVPAVPALRRLQPKECSEVQVDAT